MTLVQDIKEDAGANASVNTAEVGGAAYALGQTTMANSAPVVIASNQSSIPISNLPTTVDTNYGTVGASTVRTASEIGNSTGAAAFNAGTTSAQTIRVVLPTDQTGINTDLDKSGTGTISALNGTVTATTNGCASVVFGITGTWVATMFFKGIRQDGTGEYLYADSLSLGADTSAQSTTVNGTFMVNCSGFATVQVKAEAYTSGTATVGWNAGAGVGVLKVFQPTAASLNATVTGTISTKTALTFSSPTSATVGTSSASALASNANRKGAVFTNRSTLGVISLGVGATAVNGSGIVLGPSERWWMDEYTYSTAQINAISTVASTALAIQEITT